METNYLRVSTEDYQGGHRIGSIESNLKTLEKLFGKAHYHSDEDFPDDDYKCSVCFGLKNKTTNKYIGMWSYKYWHYNDEPINHNEKIDFSIWAEDESDIEAIQKLVNENYEE